MIAEALWLQLPGARATPLTKIDVIARVKRPEMLTCDPEGPLAGVIAVLKSIGAGGSGTTTGAGGGVGVV